MDRNTLALWWGRVIALLAGALVLAVGWVPTLGADLSQDFGSVSFAAGRFDLESSVDGQTFASDRGEGSATTDRIPVRFRIDALSPQQRVYLPFAVRLAAGSDYAARVKVSAEPAGGLPPGHWWVYQTDSFGCSASAGLDLSGLVLESGDFTLPGALTVEQPAAGHAGAAVYLCFVMAVRPDLTQGTAGELGWTLQGESLPS